MSSENKKQVGILHTFYNGDSQAENGNPFPMRSNRVHMSSTPTERFLLYVLPSSQEDGRLETYPQALQSQPLYLQDDIVHGHTGINNLIPGKKTWLIAIYMKDA